MPTEQPAGSCTAAFAAQLSGNSPGGLVRSKCVRLRELEKQVSIMPSGRVKWYDPEKGFGFIAQEGGQDVHVRSSALPSGVVDLKPGQKVDFGVADGRKGPQALQVTLLEAPPSVVAATRRPAEELHGLVDDMIKLLESKALPDLRRGRYPDRAISGRIADVMRAVAAELSA